MAKGKGGETCAEAIRKCIEPGEVLSYNELSGRVARLGTWTQGTVCQHLMALIVNLPPARDHLPNSKPFLFLRPDGRYELYHEARHPRVDADV